MSRLRKYESIFGENWVVGRYLLPVLERIGRTQNGVVLDLACGESPFRQYFPNAQPYLRVDLDPLDAEVIRGDMRSVPLPDLSVDAVLLCQAITDVPDPAAVLKEVRRILRTGGKVIVFESMCYPEHDAPQDYYRLMPEGLRAIAEAAGLQMWECIRLGGLFTRFASLWNSCLMGGLMRYRVLQPVGLLGVAAGNIICYALDRMAPHPRLASDYLAVLAMSETATDGESSPGGAGN